MLHANWGDFARHRISCTVLHHDQEQGDKRRQEDGIGERE
jgi:hypothetical protein